VKPQKISILGEDDSPLGYTIGDLLSVSRAQQPSLGRRRDIDAWH
jgi:hypothetical protein